MKGETRLSLVSLERGNLLRDIWRDSWDCEAYNRMFRRRDKEIGG